MQNIETTDKYIVTIVNGLVMSWPIINSVMISIAIYGVYLIPICWVVWWIYSGKKQRFNLLSSILAGIVAWQVLDRILKLFYFHPRPIYSILDIPGKEILFERPENSFPSDHVAFLGAIAFFFLLKSQNKQGLLLLGLAIIVGIARVASGVHYPSDIVFGLASGFVAAYIVSLAHEKLSNTIWERMIRLAQKLRLA